MSERHLHYDHARTEYSEIVGQLSQVYQDFYHGVEDIAESLHTRIGQLEKLFPELIEEFN